MTSFFYIKSIYLTPAETLGGLTALTLAGLTVTLLSRLSNGRYVTIKRRELLWDVS